MLFLAAFIMSCSSSRNSVEVQNEVAGYTLKNKKELMQQKITNTGKIKTVIATP